MSKLELILLGRFECLLPSGRRVTLAMRKAEALLAFLALAPGLRHPRERLINLLWSDRGEEQARNSLRQCLSAIRKSLGEAADLALQIDRTTVCLNGELVEVDAHEFERLAAQGDYESLVTAADLYQGEFLEGISIRDAASQEWLDSERARFKRQFVEILYNLAETQLVSHDYGNAVRSAERLVEQDPLGETGWRLLMQAYAENGQRSHALQAFKRCAQILRKELDVDPEAESVELRDRIAAGNDPARPTPAGKTVTTEPPRATRQGAQDLHAIAVLPFDNLSGDPEQEYFSDGITDSIIMNLALFPGLKVKSRNSSFAFKQQIKGLGEISRELDVDYVVEGSVRRSAGRIRVNVQLVEAASGNQVWSRRYDSDLDDLFELEESLSRSIAATVTGKIESEQQRIAIAKGAADQQAYDLLLAGTYYAHRFNRQDNVIAIEKLRQCLAQDPDNVRAHVFLYICHHMDYLNRWTANYQASFEQAGMHIRKALALDPELALVHSMYAEYLNYCEKFEEAERHLDKALAINPNDPDAIITLVWCKRNRGDDEAALALAEKACRLDPYHPWAEWRLMSSLYLCGKYEDALATAENFRTSPGFTHLYGIATLVKLGLMDKARQSLRAFLQDCRESMLSMPESLDEWRQFVRENFPFPDPKFVDDLVDCLLKAGLEGAIGGGDIPAADVAHSIAVLPFDNLSGDPEQEYFSDGISESIILTLALFPGLQVKSRNSSFAFKQQFKGLAEISRELDVDYVVEGSIRKSKNRVRITAQLVDAASGNQVWGRRYEAGLDELFDLEEELSREIAATVTGRIESDLQRVAVAKGATDQQAYDLLLAGIHHAHQFTPGDNSIAIEKLNLCLQKDPQNVRAHKQLYSCHLMNYLDRWSRDYRASFELAAEHIGKAIALAPQFDAAQVFYAQYLVFRGEFEQAAIFLDRALKTNPNNPDALTTVALNLEMQGKAEDALAAAERSCRLDPYHPWAEWEVAVSLFLAGKYERVIEKTSTMRTSPGFIRIFGIASNVRLGKIEAARRELEIFLQECRAEMLAMPRSSDDWLRYLRENYPFADPQINRDILEDLLRAGLHEQVTKGTSVESTSSRDTSIAVLPFDNLSGDPEQEYFSDGITESIILNLALFPGLHVKSRNSSFAFKQQLKGLAEISRELEVDYLVEGSIRKSKDRIRITAQLIDATNGNQVWGKRYDAVLNDLFDLEENLSREIAATVTGRIESDLQRVAIAKGAADQQAYDLLLAGMFHVSRFNSADNTVAIEKFERCLAQDPDNVRAHVGLYICYSMAYLGRWIENYKDCYNKAWEYIRRATQLDPEDRTAQIFLGEMLSFSGELDKAKRQIDKVLAQNPNDTDALAVLATIHSFLCDPESALKTAEHALKLDPFHPWAEWELAVGRYYCKDYEGTVDAVSTMRATPGFISLYKVAALVRLESIDEARTALKEFMRECESSMKVIPRDIDEWIEYTHENYLFVEAQRNRELVDMLLRAGLDEFLPSASAQPDPASLPSILVLPFANQSGDPEQEYFSDGITESVILYLGSFGGLRAKSRHASFAFKDSSRDITDIAAATGVQYVVEGSIRKSADRVRIMVQLSDTASGDQLWGKRFDSGLENLLDLEQELSQTIAGTVIGRIGRNLRQAALRKPARDLQSYDYLMRGSHHIEFFTAKDIDIAIEQFEKCLALDPGNAQAHAMLGMSHLISLYENTTDDRERSFELAGQYLDRSLELNPDDASAQAFMAEYLFFHKDFDGGLAHARKALELNPTLADGYSMLAWHAGSTRQYDKALEYARLSMQVDQFHPYAGWNAGEVYRLTGDYERAIETFRSMRHISSSVHAQIAACFAGLGRIDEARAEMRQFLELAREQMIALPASRDDWYRLWDETMPYKYSEDTDEFFDLLLRAGLLGAESSSVGDMPSIAVLPFENMSGDPEQEHFADGITTDIIATLSKFRHLRTVSRYSTLRYKQDRAPIADIAAQQGVRYILEGSVRKSGTRIRVSAELIDSSDGQIQWSERYDRDLDDLFAVQDEITRNIATAMKVQFDDGEKASYRSAGTRNIQAWEMTLIATDLQDTYVQRYIQESRAKVREALELDPEYAFAWVILGWTYFQEAYNGSSDSIEASVAEAEKANRRALELDPELAEGWSQSGLIQMMKSEPEKALQHCRKAVELEPGNAEVQVLMAFACIYVGDLEQARAHNAIMLELCPIPPNWYYLPGGLIEQLAGDPVRASEIFRRGVEAQPDSPLCRFYLLHALLESGDGTGAARVAEEIRRLSAAASGKGVAHAISKDAAVRARFRASLEKYDLH